MIETGLRFNIDDKASNELIMTLSDVFDSRQKEKETKCVEDVDRR